MYAPYLPAGRPVAQPEYTVTWGSRTWRAVYSTDGTFTVADGMRLEQEKQGLWRLVDRRTGRCPRGLEFARFRFLAPALEFVVAVAAPRPVMPSLPRKASLVGVSAMAVPS